MNTTSGLFKSLDDKCREIATHYTRSWIKKHKFKYHKYDLRMMIRGWAITYWAATSIFLAFRMFTQHDNVSGTFMIVVGVGIPMIMGSLEMKLEKDRKNWYDEIWLQRKNPVVYRVMKHVVEQMWQEDYGFRKGLWAMEIGFVFLLMFTNPWLVLLTLEVLARTYIYHVFDFDEPEKKEKPKESLTEITKKAWENLISNPQIT